MKSHSKSASGALPACAIYQAELQFTPDKKSPASVASENFLGWHAMLHHSGVRHSLGGSGALTQAMVKGSWFWK